MLNPTSITLKKTINTIPAVYSCLAIHDRHLYVALIQLAPNQKPNEYAANMAKNAAPILIPPITPNLIEPFEPSFRQSSYILDSNSSPLSIFTVLIAAKACSALPPAMM